MEWDSCINNGIATLKCLPLATKNLIDFLFKLSAAVCVVMVIYAGLKYVMSRGDPQAVASARKTLIYSLVGFATVLSSFWILRIFGFITGTQCISSFGFTQCI